MSENIGNCIRCNRLFKLSEGNKCHQCAATEQEQFSQAFRLLQGARHDGGIHAKDLAMETGMSESIIEEYFIDGKWGTGAKCINFTCKKCGVTFSGVEGHSTICITCRNLVSDVAGVDIQSREAVTEKQKEDKRLELLSRVKSFGEASGMRAAAGFQRNH